MVIQHWTISNSMVQGSYSAVVMKKEDPKTGTAAGNNSAVVIFLPHIHSLCEET
jgi:hypothetical protein